MTKRPFAGTAWRPGADGAPLIECALDAVLDGGDHAIALGRVTSLTTHRDTGPLLYFRRTYGRLPLPLPARALSSSSMSASMASARSRSEA
ncbi:flavin reductase [Streptomyces sp. NPDC002992]|uniref:flavin reductase n=1 Tax=Streptomyces sp. NPDC002992 TaxID=3154273 RepID=UPI0033A6E950